MSSFFPIIFALASTAQTAGGLELTGEANDFEDKSQRLATIDADDGSALNAQSLVEPSQTCDDNGCVISYPAAFFNRYNPINANDMALNVPGFTIDDGDGSRGFAGAAGNVLINSKRPATKSDSASDILSRISTSSVERIDLIRGQTGGLDLRGQSVAINVILRAGSANALTWEAGNRYRVNSPGIFPFGKASFTDQSGDLTYTIGAQIRRDIRAFGGPELLLDANDSILEIREEEFRRTESVGALNFNGQLTRGINIFRLNGSIEYSQNEGLEISERFPPAQTPVNFVLQSNGNENLDLEVGGEFERPLGEDIGAKLIALYRRNDRENTGSLADGPKVNEVLTSVVTLSEALNTEAIIRTEIDYSGIDGHLLEFSAEGAINTLSSAFSLQVDEDGALVQQDVLGAITEVQEVRGDFSISDSFKINDIAIDAVVAAEISTIEQTGGFEANRTFFFLKPSLTATWFLSDKKQLRLRTLREVGQLNFNDFVSSTDLGDGELALGNPDLAPQTTWVVDVTYERRFGEIGAASVTGFYNFISDVSDVLPIGNGLEVPGNIGSGIIRGVSAEATLPFDWLGFENSRFDFNGVYRDSLVTDPVTGETRKFSNLRPWQLEFAFRQDIVAQRWAWGWDSRIRSDTIAFNLDELEVFIRRPDVDVFIETTRYAGIKINFTIENILNEGFDRDRTVFASERDLSPVIFREVRERNIGRRLLLTFSGTF